MNSRLNCANWMTLCSVSACAPDGLSPFLYLSYCIDAELYFITKKLPTWSEMLKVLRRCQTQRCVESLPCCHHSCDVNPRLEKDPVTGASKTCFYPGSGENITSGFTETFLSEVCLVFKAVLAFWRRLLLWCHPLCLGVHLWLCVCSCLLLFLLDVCRWAGQSD